MLSKIQVRRPSATGVVAVLALFMATTGSAAAGAKLITGKDIKNSSVTAADIKNKSLGLSDFSSSARKGLTGKTGAAGPAGPKGDTGAPGPKGDRGPSTIIEYSPDGTHEIGALPGTFTFVANDAPVGSYLIQAKFEVANTSAIAGAPKCELLVARDGEIEVIDTIDQVILTAEGTNTAVHSYSLVGVAELGGAENAFAARCDPPGAQTLAVTDRVLVATQAGTIEH